MITFLTWLVASSIFANYFQLGESHGYVVSPISPRNVVIRHDCHNCANGDGPCGEGNQWVAAASASDLDGPYTTPLHEIRAGSTINVAIRLTAPHKGIFTVELCRPTGTRITHECFTHRLKRDPTDERFSPYVPHDPEIFFFQVDSCSIRELQEARFIVPTDFGDCDHCVLRWFWQTGNSCNPRPITGPEVAAWSRNGCGTARSEHMSSCGTDCPRAPPTCFGEHFRNCMDVRVTGSSGGGGIQTTTTTTQTTTTVTTATTTQTTTTTTTPGITTTTQSLTTTTPGSTTSTSQTGCNCIPSEAAREELRRISRENWILTATLVGQLYPDGGLCMLTTELRNELRDVSHALDYIASS